jgi:hypothetical protein
MRLVPYRRDRRVEEDRNGRWESMDLHCSLAMFCGSKDSVGPEQLLRFPDAPRPHPGVIVGTVVDLVVALNDGAIPESDLYHDEPPEIDRHFHR